MIVKDIDEFIEDIDEYQVKDVERWEDEKGNLRHLIVVMERPFAEITQKLHVDAWYNKEKEYDMQARNPKMPAMQIGGAEWYELTYNPDKQDESIDEDAKVALYRIMYNGDVDFDEVLDIPYKVELRRGGK